MGGVEVLAAVDAELSHAARLGQHARLEGADGGVVVLDGAAERTAQASQVLDEGAEPVVHLARERQDVARVLRQRLLSPALSDRGQQRVEGGRCRHHDPATECVLDEGAIDPHRPGQEPVVGQEEHHEGGSPLEHRVVLARGQRVDVAPHVAGVPLERCWVPTWRTRL